jgi:hypothetical protein
MAKAAATQKAAATTASRLTFTSVVILNDRLTQQFSAEVCSRFFEFPEALLKKNLIKTVHLALPLYFFALTEQEDLCRECRLLLGLTAILTLLTSSIKYFRWLSREG